MLKKMLPIAEMSGFFRGVSSMKLDDRFKDENDCLIYLSEIKH
jgi:hypothetical protein